MKETKMSARWALALAAAISVQCAFAETPDERAAKTLSQMTMDEKINLVFGYFSTDFKGTAKPKEGVPQAAGFLYGTERLGVPHLAEKARQAASAAERLH